jgi:peroxiredoxin
MLTRKVTIYGFGFLIVAFAVSNILLIRQNIQLRGELAKVQQRGLRAGDKVPPFSAAGLDGRPVQISYTGGGPKRMLIYFTPTCRFCRAQFPYWKEALEHAESNGYEVVGLVNETEDRAKLAEYIREMGCSADSQKPLKIALVPEEIKHSYQLSATPITLLVNNEGTVQKAWVGQWSVSDVGEASTSLGFTFSLH